MTYGPRTPSQERTRLFARRRRIDLIAARQCVGCEAPHVGCTTYCPACRVKRANEQRARRDARREVRVLFLFLLTRWMRQATVTA